LLRRLIITTIFLLIPLKAFALDFTEARQLLSRTGFDPDPHEIEKIMPLSREAAIDKLLNEVNTVAANKPPAWVHQPPVYANKKQLTKEEKNKLRKIMKNQENELKTWWYKEMISTDSPLTEHMTLFWHNHFTSSYQKVKSPQLLYNQNTLLRKYATGNFRELLHNISKDPAMIIYLDNQSNNKGKPNENFAREVMELFTLGEGHYTELDIKEGARAFTGWKTNKAAAKFIFNKKQHDNGIKKFMGKQGNFTGDDILNIILEKSQVSVFITEKLWKEFISDKPDKAEVERLATIFRKNNYELKPLLKALFTSPYFYKKENMATMIKSPVELIVGTIRLFNIPIEDKNKNITQLLRYGNRLGQDIFAPPNVKGWPGGDRWITSDTLLTRQQLLQRITSGNEIFSKNYQENHRQNLPRNNIMAIWTDQPDSNKNLDYIKKLVLPLEPVKNLAATSKINFVRQSVLDPVYQLK
jgi:uncharacterized protein (DUF1800 family)